MSTKLKSAALCAAISLLLGSFSTPLFTGVASAASVASEHKAYVESAAAREALQGEPIYTGLDAIHPQAARVGTAHRTFRKCLNTHLDKTYGAC